MGGSWRVTGSIVKSGRTIRSVSKIVQISSERDLETAEREMRESMYEDACRLLKKAEFGDVKIEVESDIKSE
jgi:hypothetical protein